MSLICLLYACILPITYFVDMATVYDGKTTWTRRLFIEEVDPPHFLYFGDSHIGRLCLWSMMMEDSCGPNSWEHKLLKHGEYVYSGGSKWSTILNRMRGIEVPVHQKQGDTWSRMLNNYHKGLFKPTHIFLSMSGNDVCAINDKYYIKIRSSNIWHLLTDIPYGPSDYCKHNHLWFDDRINPPMKQEDFNHEIFLQQQKNSIYKSIDSVMKVLSTHFPECKIFVLGALPRKHWFPEMLEILSDINKYLRIKHKVSVVQVHKFVKRCHLEKDGIHFNKEGYKVLMSKGVGPVFDSYYAMVKKPVIYDVPEYWDNMSKPQRKRFIKRLNKKRNKYE